MNGSLINIYRFAGYKIIERHNLLGRTIGTRREENVSYENVTLLIKVTLPYFMITSILEVIVFLLYNKKV